MFSFPRLIFLWLFFSVLIGCDNQTQLPVANSKLTINLPAANEGAQRKLNDYEGATLEIRVNSGEPQVFEKQSGDVWVVKVLGIALNELNTVDILWYLADNGERYDVASQIYDFIADPEQGPYNVEPDYIHEPYDHDADGVSNLNEINAGGFPVQAGDIPEVTSIQSPSPQCFLIGSPVAEHAPFGYSQETQVETCIFSDYSIGKYEVTYAQYDVFANAVDSQELPSDNGWGRGDLPVTNVTWNDANEYTKWLSIITGKTYRLPTEAEWEYAARGITTTAYNTGPTINSTEANFSDRSSGEVTAVFYYESFDPGVDTLAGVFRVTASGTWREFKIVDGSTVLETPLASFEEFTRDANGVHLFDSSRNYTVRLSLDDSIIYIALDQLQPGGLATSRLYPIAEGPLPVGLRTVPVGSFSANNFGLHDMHGNVYEWTCSVLQSTYAGAESMCVEVLPIPAIDRMVKRGGSWNHTKKDVRSAKRGWNNNIGVGDIRTGFRVVLEQG